MRSSNSAVRRGQRLVRMVSELHRLGYQRLRIFPYEYPLAWRLAVVPRAVCSMRNGAYMPHSESWPFPTTYSAASENAYFGWQDAQNDDARALAEKFLTRFRDAAERGHGRDWEYAGWLCELLGVLEQGDLLPFVMAEYFEPQPEALQVLPIRDLKTHAVRLDFPLPPPGDTVSI